MARGRRRSRDEWRAACRGRRRDAGPRPSSTLSLNMPVRFGYVTPNSWGLDTPQQVVDLAVQAEALGADSLWVSHHVLHRGFVVERLVGQRAYHDPLVTLAAFASATTTARLGTSVLVVPYLHPMPTAKTLATIDHLSHGRLDVGVGVGALQVEHDVIAQVPYERRGAYGDEFIEVMQLLWTPGPSSFSGEFFSFDDVEAYPGPFADSGIPVYVGGHSPRAIRRTARFAVRLARRRPRAGRDPGCRREPAARVRTCGALVRRSARPVAAAHPRRRCRRRCVAPSLRRVRARGRDRARARAAERRRRPAPPLARHARAATQHGSGTAGIRRRRDP